MTHSSEQIEAAAGVSTPAIVTSLPEGRSASEDANADRPDDSLTEISAQIRTFTASDGVTQHFRHWKAAGECRGLVVALHGIQSHSGWYEWSSKRIAEAGFEVYFADRRGSGLNGFRRGHADHGLRLLHDVRQLVRLARNEHGTAELPVTLLGVSWGGRIAAAFAATYPDLIDRLVLLYPGIKPKIRPTWWQNIQLDVARDFDVRDKSVEIPLSDPALFTDNVAAQHFIQNDPLTLHQVTTGFLNSGRDLDQVIDSSASQITHPTLTMLSGQDEIIDNRATRNCLATFGSRHLTTITYDHARHTLEFDSQREQFVNDLVNWLNNRQ